MNSYVNYQFHIEGNSMGRDKTKGDQIESSFLIKHTRKSIKSYYPDAMIRFLTFAESSGLFIKETNTLLRAAFKLPLCSNLAMNKHVYNVFRINVFHHGKPTFGAIAMRSLDMKVYFYQFYGHAIKIFSKLISQLLNRHRKTTL